MRRSGCWVAYVVVALVVSGLWATVIIVGSMVACDLEGGNCDTNRIGVGLLAVGPALLFVLVGVAEARWERIQAAAELRDKREARETGTD